VHLGKNTTKSRKRYSNKPQRVQAILVHPQCEGVYC